MRRPAVTAEAAGAAILGAAVVGCILAAVTLWRNWRAKQPQPQRKPPPERLEHTTLAALPHLVVEPLGRNALS